jgi:hypothetical protein
MHDLNLVACIEAAVSVFLAGNDVSVHLNGDAFRPETKLGHQIR